MTSLWSHIAIVLLPLIVSNCMHMIVVKINAFAFLKQPISNDKFGANKTWRGLVFVPIANGFALVLMRLIFNLNVAYPFALGVALGLAYVIFELPNSYLKRRQGIAPGTSSKSNKIGFQLLDKTDSAFGVSLIYFVLSSITYQNAFILFLMSSSVHVLISVLLVQIKLKKTF